MSSYRFLKEYKNEKVSRAKRDFLLDERAKNEIINHLEYVYASARRGIVTLDEAMKAIAETRI